MISVNQLKPGDVILGKAGGREFCGEYFQGKGNYWFWCPRNFCLPLIISTTQISLFPDLNCYNMIISRPGAFKY